MKKVIIPLSLIVSLPLFSSSFSVTNIVGESCTGISKSRSKSHISGFIHNFENEQKVDLEENIPLVYSLEQNYPNPFNPTTTIKFSLPADEKVMITIFNVSGKEVKRLVSSEFKAGYHSINFDGSSLASGQYFYSIKAGNFSKVKKMLLIR